MVTSDDELNDLIWDTDYPLEPMRSVEDTELEIEFLRETLGFDADTSFLDVACGNGRHARALSEERCRVVAVDRSRKALRDGITLSDSRRKRLRWVCADMRDLPFVAAFDVALCLFASFGYYDDEDNERSLRSMLRALVPGGRLVLETWNPLSMSALDGFRNWWTTPDAIYLAGAEFDAQEYVIHDAREVIHRKTGKSRTWARAVRLYSTPELVRIARDAGAELVEAFGGYDGNAPDAASPSVITIWERVDR